MTETEKNELFEKYNDRTHVYGRIACIVTLILLIGAPFVMGLYLGAMPNMPAFGKAFLAVGIVWFVSCIAEYLVYTPMLGAGGSYLAFMTGNLINMKIPCAVNARDIVGAKTGTPENEIISTLSIATASLVTVVVLAALHFSSPCSLSCRIRRSSPRLKMLSPRFSAQWRTSISATT